MAKVLHQALEHWDGDPAQVIQIIADRKLTLPEFIYQWYAVGQGFDDLQGFIEGVPWLLDPERLDELEYFILSDGDEHSLTELREFPEWLARVDIVKVVR